MPDFKEGVKVGVFEVVQVLEDGVKFKIAIFGHSALLARYLIVSTMLRQVHFRLDQKYRIERPLLRL